MWCYSSAGSNAAPNLRDDWIRDAVAGRSCQVNREKHVAYSGDLNVSPDLSQVNSPEMRLVRIGGVDCLEGQAQRGAGWR